MKAVDVNAAFIREAKQARDIDFRYSVFIFNIALQFQHTVNLNQQLIVGHDRQTDTREINR